MKKTTGFLVAIMAVYSVGAQSFDPGVPAVGREFPTTEFMSYTSRETAQADDYSASPYYKALDGAGEFTVPFAWADKQVFLHVETGESAVYVSVNGREAGYAEGTNAPAEFDITTFVHEGRNTLEITGEAMNGFYVKALPKVRVRDFDIRTNLTENYRNGVLDFGVIVKSHFLNEKSARVYFEIFSPSGELLKSESRDVTLRLRQEQTVHFEAMVPDVMAWNSENPNLYTVMTRIQYEGRYVEYIQRKVGFRSIELVDGQLLVNGGRIQLDSVYRVSEAWMGPLGRYGNDPAMLENVLDRVRIDYFRHRNDPAVVAFSLGGQEAVNGYDFYEAYLWMKEHESVRPVVFRSAGREWNTDGVENLDF